MPEGRGSARAMEGAEPGSDQGREDALGGRRGCHQHRAGHGPAACDGSQRESRGKERWRRRRAGRAVRGSRACAGGRDRSSRSPQSPLWPAAARGRPAWRAPWPGAVRAGQDPGQGGYLGSGTAGSGSGAAGDGGGGGGGGGGALCRSRPAAMLLLLLLPPLLPSSSSSSSHLFLRPLLFLLPASRPPPGRAPPAPASLRPQRCTLPSRAAPGVVRLMNRLANPNVGVIQPRVSIAGDSLVNGDRGPAGSASRPARSRHGAAINAALSPSPDIPEGSFSSHSRFHLGFIALGNDAAASHSRWQRQAGHLCTAPGGGGVPTSGGFEINLDVASVLWVGDKLGDQSRIGLDDPRGLFQPK